MLGSDPDEVETNAAEDNEPDGIDWGVRVGIDLAPEAVLNVSYATKPTRDSLYLEKGKAPSLANAYAILVSANSAEIPVKNWINITKNHITVPPTLPPALRKIWAAGMPVGDAMVASRSPRQKQNVTVNIHPIIPETMTAILIAIGPRTAASWVSSDMLQE